MVAGFIFTAMISPLLICLPAALLLFKLLNSAAYAKLARRLNHGPRRLLLIVLACLFAGLAAGTVRGCHDTLTAVVPPR